MARFFGLPRCASTPNCIDPMLELLDALNRPDALIRPSDYRDGLNASNSIAQTSGLPRCAQHGPLRRARPPPEHRRRPMMKSCPSGQRRGDHHRGAWGTWRFPRIASAQPRELNVVADHRIRLRALSRIAHIASIARRPDALAPGPLPRSAGSLRSLTAAATVPATPCVRQASTAPAPPSRCWSGGSRCIVRYPLAAGTAD